MGNPISRANDLIIDEQFDIDPSVDETWDPRTILLVGRFNSGKTWLARQLLQKAGIDSTKIVDGLHEHTTNAIIYSNAFGKGSKVSLFGESGDFAICDTEGTLKVKSESAANDGHCLNLGPFLLSLLHNLHGLIVYMAHDFNRYDEIMLRVLTSVIPLSRRIVVVHNEMNSGIHSLGKKRTKIAKFDHLKVAWNDLTQTLQTANLNGHNFEHIILLQDASIPEKRHNEAMMRRLVQKVDLPKKLVPGIRAAQLHFRQMIEQGRYTFRFDNVDLTYRLLARDEMSEDGPAALDEVNRARFKKIFQAMKRTFEVTQLTQRPADDSFLGSSVAHYAWQRHFRVLEIAVGGAGVDDFTLDKPAEIGETELMSDSLNFKGLVRKMPFNQPAQRTVFWTPDAIIGQPLGQIQHQNQCHMFIYVQSTR